MLSVTNNAADESAGVFSVEHAACMLMDGEKFLTIAAVALDIYETMFYGVLLRLNRLHILLLGSECM